MKYFFILLVFSLNACSSNIEKEKIFFREKIHLGMMKKDVILILGNPDTIAYSVVDSRESALIYYIKDNIIPPHKEFTILFDTVDKVKFISFGE